MARGSYVVRNPSVPDFREVGGVTPKLVPIRRDVESEEFPVRQPGVTAPEGEAVVALAEKYGARVDGESLGEERVVVRGSGRRPDGNTVEPARTETR